MRQLRRGSRVILGLGNDLIDIRRIEKTIAKHGERSWQVYRSNAPNRPPRGRLYAKPRRRRLAALGTG